MRWKDFLYFQRETKIAVILLLLLMALTLILNIWLGRMRSSEIVLRENDSIVQAFETFQRSLRLPRETRSRERSGWEEGDGTHERGMGEVRERADRGTEKQEGDQRVGESRDVRERERVVPWVSKDMREKIDRTAEDAASQKGKDNRSTSASRYRRIEKLAPGETISLNETDTTVWQKIPGIGSSFAARIVKYRELLGGFVRKEQLLEVYGMDPERYDRIAPYIEEGGSYRKIKLNEWEFKALLRHPYLNYKQVQEVVTLRRKKGRITSLAQLAMLDAFTYDDLLRLEPYLEF